VTIDRVTGEPDGIAALRAMVHEHRDYLKFLLVEAQTNADHRATFKAPDGTQYALRLDVLTGAMEVTRVP
jgi:hypothetical protein